MITLSASFSPISLYCSERFSPMVTAEVNCHLFKNEWVTLWVVFAVMLSVEQSAGVQEFPCVPCFTTVLLGLLHLPWKFLYTECWGSLALSLSKLCFRAVRGISAWPFFLAGLFLNLRFSLLPWTCCDFQFVFFFQFNSHRHNFP